MPIIRLRDRGPIFQFEGWPPAVVSGSKTNNAHSWKFCPYSTQITNYNGDSRVSGGQKTFHSETNGWMHSYSVSGLMGWACADNGCSFFLGTATDEVDQAGRRFVPASGTTAGPLDLPTLSGSVQHLVIPRTIVSGTRYLEI
mgnify:CR=1 FL=1